MVYVALAHPRGVPDDFGPHGILVCTDVPGFVYFLFPMDNESVFSDCEEASMDSTTSTILNPF